MTTTFVPGHPAVAALQCPNCRGLMEQALSFRARICMRCGHVTCGGDADVSRIVEQAARAQAREEKAKEG